MKLRLQANSLRLRLKRGEVDQLVRTGRVEEIIVFGGGDQEILRYVLEVSPEATTPRARREGPSVLIQLPPETASRWALGDEVGIESIQPAGEGELRILIEKDFACLNGTEQQNVDTFPNPLAGTKC